MKQITQVEMAGQLVAPVGGECATVDMTAVRSHDAHGVAVEPCEPHHLVAAPQGSDLEERILVSEQRNRPTDVEGGRPVAGNDGEEFLVSTIGGVCRRWRKNRG